MFCPGCNSRQRQLRIRCHRQSEGQSSDEDDEDGVDGHDSTRVGHHTVELVAIGDVDEYAQLKNRHWSCHDSKLAVLRKHSVSDNQDEKERVGTGCGPLHA